MGLLEGFEEGYCDVGNNDGQIPGEIVKSLRSEIDG